ncbi:TIGR03862 family flavoprotein [Caenimonas koreensis DSM 17982]|uniref:TIGR03862 family flavoprotein n=1 Tax=Caenimonas koreensis DSM 17982 TaxID=1121255 RepID=A0A844B931_9BURK|nr:TIGR03862 family flavoprotein [Caenimonas koreensis]MRD48109.1 TIGR03862 family flavoprotein [Caenimonas koreensis DSM 17982]
MTTNAIIGAGPAGLMAAEVLSQAGASVDVYDAMPSGGRKFLLAGKGGLNLTHAEPFDVFVTRYGARSANVQAWLGEFGPQAVRDWAAGLGIETFVGTSSRVFPKEMKAAPLLRAWIHRLRAAGVRFHMRHRFTGWTAGGHLKFETPAGESTVEADAVVMAMGGASWPQLGSDGAWLAALEKRGAKVAPLLPSNCGFDVRGGWSAYFRERFAGQPFKSVAIRHGDFLRQGEFVATETGVEGSLIYAASAMLRDEVLANGEATFELDLLPGRTAAQVAKEVAHPRGSRSLPSHLKSRLSLDGIKLALLHELVPAEALNDATKLAAAIKALPITVVAARPIAEAISTAGGVTFDSLDENLMVTSAPGVFCAGEMIDWEAPTGGYLLTACLASGRAAGQGVLAYRGVVASRAAQNLAR